MNHVLRQVRWDPVEVRIGIFHFKLFCKAMEALEGLGYSIRPYRLQVKRKAFCYVPKKSYVL
jgi:hypothetical protein